MCVINTGTQDELRVNSNYDVTAEIGKEEDYIVQDYGISADEGGGYSTTAAGEESWEGLGEAWQYQRQFILCGVRDWELCCWRPSSVAGFRAAVAMWQKGRLQLCVGDLGPRTRRSDEWARWIVPPSLYNQHRSVKPFLQKEDIYCDI